MVLKVLNLNFEFSFSWNGARGSKKIDMSFFHKSSRKNGKVAVMNHAWNVNVSLHGHTHSWQFLSLMETETGREGRPSCELERYRDVMEGEKGREQESERKKNLL